MASDDVKKGYEEVTKLKKHLELLREEHVKVQGQLVALQRKYDVLLASRRPPQASDDSGASPDFVSESFVQRLLDTVTHLFEKDLYSDVIVHLDGHQLRAHRFVLAARGDNWGVSDLSSAHHLNFDDMQYNIGYTLLKWVYTDQLDLKLGETFLLDLMKAARKFQLNPLFTRCEQLVMSRLDVGNAVGIYQAADEMEAANLRDRCSELISARWEDFSSADFVSMSGQLLYKMLRSKVQFPLHSAIRLRREDVVFLFLIEFDSELHIRLNETDQRGELPLSLALESGQDSLARTLVSHRANVDAFDDHGKALLLNAILKREVTACKFLLENGANPDCGQPGTGAGPLHLLAATVEPSGSDMDSVLDLLLARNPNLNSLDAEETTPLHCAVQAGNETFLDRIFAIKAVEVDLVDSNGRTPLSLALALPDESKSLRIAAKLIQKGAYHNRCSEQTGDSLLHENVAAGRLSAVRFLLDAGSEVNARNVRGETGLHVACRAGLEELVSLLLQKGADPRVQSAAGSQTPLHVAIENDQSEIAQRILTLCRSEPVLKPDLSLTNSDGETVLGMALWVGFFHVAKQLIEDGADVNARNEESWTLLLRAIEAGSADVALFLISQGADASVRSPRGSSALELAVKASLPSVVRALCVAGADLNSRDVDGVPPLWTALEAEDEEVASALVEHGCDTDFWAPGPSGCLQTMLHRAIDENNQFIACFLIRSLCNVNALRRPGAGGEGSEEAEDKQTPLHLAATWGLEAVVAALIEHGADVNAQDVEGKTPVHMAVANQHQGILELLLRAPHLNLSIKDRRGATPFACAMQVKNNKAAEAILGREPRVANQVDGRGFNFLHSAVKNSDLESVLFLLSVHMDVNVPVQDSSGLRCLHLAAVAGDEMILRNLLLAGSSLDSVTSRKKSALHLAAENDNARICEILIENGINCDALDADQNNALHLAVQHGSVSCVRVLLTQSTVNAQAVNAKGQTCLHMLGQYGKDNSSAIFELFLETMPEYPVDKTDADGNTMLLLAYMQGNAQLCKAAVCAGACLGATNRHGVSIFSHQTPTKQLLFRLLDQLSSEPRWADGDNCSECGNRFSITVRKHHCRHCGRLLCAKCSERSMPVLKYDLHKPVRVCDVCYDVLTLGSHS